MGPLPFFVQHPTATQQKNERFTTDKKIDACHVKSYEPPEMITQNININHNNHKNNNFCFSELHWLVLDVLHIESCV